MDSVHFNPRPNVPDDNRDLDPRTLVQCWGRLAQLPLFPFLDHQSGFSPFGGDLSVVIGSANAGGAVPANANAVSGPGASANQRGTTSDCGSEYTRSLDDIAGNSLARLENKTEGSIKLNIPNLSNLRAKVNTSFHHIANLPWRLAAKTECTKRTSHVKFFSVYIDCNPESESTLWSCDAIVEFRLLSQRPDVPHFSRQVC
ncbi:hypothetical protein ANCCAN_09480 [Ancylostoma caninum]|uniref:MATH domain-containing protein n=1 Tax=Ancylostoma caninum TaxID=29170 RepID=A0A368GMH1_ANCCA|nr:hypothetical protein ANCCAN_09480 [Ancylostoma caninum]